MLERLLADVDPGVARILDGALSGRELGVDDAARLLAARGPDLHALTRAADLARRDDKGDDVSYVVCRNINFTNVCYVGCTFCGFARHRDEADAFEAPPENLHGARRELILGVCKLSEELLSVLDASAAIAAATADIGDRLDGEAALHGAALGN